MEKLYKLSISCGKTLKLKLTVLEGKFSEKTFMGEKKRISLNMLETPDSIVNDSSIFLYSFVYFKNIDDLEKMKKMLLDLVREKSYAKFLEAQETYLSSQKEPEFSAEEKVNFSESERKAMLKSILESE